MTGDGASTTSQREQDDFEGAAVRRRVSTRIGAIVGAVALAGTLAACSGGTPGVAAKVDDTNIPVSDVEDALADLKSAGAESPLGIIAELVNAVYINGIADEFGFAATDEQAEEYLTTAVFTEENPAPEEFSTATLEIGRRYAAQSNLQQLDAATVMEINESVSEPEVTVNPRYGEFDPAVGFASTTYPWILAADADAAATTATAE